MVFSVPFGCCRVVEDFFYEFPAFFGELPSPAWSFVAAGAVPVDAVDVSCSFEFDHAASEALRRIAVTQHWGYCRQVFLGGWFLEQVEDGDHVSLWGVVH